MAWNMNDWHAQWDPGFSATGTDNKDYCRDDDSLGAHSLVGIHANGSGGSPPNGSTTVTCPICSTKLEAITNTTLATQHFPYWPGPSSDVIAGASPGTTISFTPASVFSTPVVGGGGYDQSAGIFQSQQNLPAIQTELHQQYTTKTMPSMSPGGVTAGTRSIHVYKDNDSHNNIMTYDTRQPISSRSNGNSPSDQSSPNESYGIKRKRSENKEQPARGRKSSSSGLIAYVCAIEGCNKKYGSKKEVDRHLYESRAHMETYKPKYFCEEERCEKFKEPFTRKDNLSRHIKAMHGEFPS